MYSLSSVLLECTCHTHNFFATLIKHALVIGFPKRGGGPRADVGEDEDFMGTLQLTKFLLLSWGEMWGVRCLNDLLSGRMWGFWFCSTERRLGMIDCSLDRC